MTWVAGLIKKGSPFRANSNLCTPPDKEVSKQNKKLQKLFYLGN